MTISFTEEEKKYIVKEPFNWHMAEDTPENIRKTLQRKLDLLYREKDKDYRITGRKEYGLFTEITEPTKNKHRRL